MSEIQFQPIEPKRLAFELRGLGKEREHRAIQMELNRAAIEIENYGDRIAQLEADLAAAQAELQRMTIKWAPVAIERDEARAEAQALRALLIRYRNEVPLGHQPHMIAHLVDAAIDQAKRGAADD